MKTRILIDVDGVINAFAFNMAATRDIKHWPTDPTTHNINGYRFTIFDEVTAWILETEKREDVEFQWLTTWRADAPAMISPVVGYGVDWFVHDGDNTGTSWAQQRDSDNGRWWKLKFAQDVLTRYPEDRVVWIDDDLYDSEARHRSKPFEQAGRLLLIQPGPHHGLNPAHLSMINAFLEEE